MSDKERIAELEQACRDLIDATTFELGQKTLLEVECDQLKTELAQYNEKLATAHHDYWEKHNELVETQRQYAELEAKLKQEQAFSAELESNIRFLNARVEIAESTLAAEISRHRDRIAQCEQQAQRIAELEGKLAWISVKERLPEDGVEVVGYIGQLVGVDDGFSSRLVVWLDCDTDPPNWICRGETIEGVTGWMPLPAAPKGEL